jgi:hypothetical protein
MKTSLLALVFLLGVVAVALGQQKSEPQSSYNKNDFGFNAYYIIQQVYASQSQTPFSIMYKKYTDTGKALRLGFSGSFNLNDTDLKQGSINTSYNEGSFIQFDLTIGKEKLNDLGGKWVWYHGGDLLPGFQFSNSENYTNDQKINASTITTYRFGIRPFLGLRFNVNPRLYISAEASAQLTYSRSKNANKNYNPEQNMRESTTDNIAFNLNPASGLFIFYRF